MNPINHAAKGASTQISVRLHGLLLAALITFLASPVLNLESQEPVFSTDVKVVSVLATVRTKQGQIVRNLTKDDFSLEEDGRPQTIGYFTHESDLPLTLGLIIDTSMSQARILEQERNASYRFLDQVLREDKDKAFIIQFDQEAVLLQDLTSSRRKLEDALSSLRTPEPVDVRGGNSPGQWPGIPGGFPGPGTGTGRRRGGGGAQVGRGGTALYDAVFLAADELMKRQTGRKALIVLTDGVDNASMVSLERAVESAQRFDTLVYSILYADTDMYSGGGFGSPRIGGMGGGRRGGPVMVPMPTYPNGSGVLSKMSKETGGRMFEVSRNQSVGEIYSTIEEELRNQYSIGYSPQRETNASGFHKINLRAKQKDLIVQTRSGYYADH